MGAAFCLKLLTDFQAAWLWGANAAYPRLRGRDFEPRLPALPHCRQTHLISNDDGDSVSKT